MKKHKNGSVTLTRQEIDELNTAYHHLYNLLDDMPAFMSDFFEDRQDYKNVQRWSAWLDGSEYQDEDDESTTEWTDEDRFIDAHIYEEDMEDDE